MTEQAKRNMNADDIIANDGHRDAQAILVLMVTVPTGLLVYRDDTGRCVAEKLAHRARIFPSHPAVGTFVVMCIVLTTGFSMYGASYWLIRATGLATAVACPWPYPEAKVYDPRGDYELAGTSGPYAVGIWSTWMSGQPSGRPEFRPLTDGGRCGKSMSLPSTETYISGTPTVH